MKNSTVSPLPILEEIQKKGFLNSTALPVYSQKLTHAFKQFLGHSPVLAQSAEICMEKLNSLGKTNPRFYSLFQDVVMRLHDHASKKEALTKAQADIQLLCFFAQEAPQTIQGKQELLKKIKEIPQLEEKRNLVSNTIYTLSDHYVKNHQYNEDSNKDVLASLSNILNIVSSKRKLYGHFEKPAFSYSADIIKLHAPAFYNTIWAEKFRQIKRPTKLCIPTVKDAVEVGPQRTTCRRQCIRFSDMTRG